MTVVHPLYTELTICRNRIQSRPICPCYNSLYGPQRFAFSEKVSKLIWEYIKGNKLLETDKTSGTLFGKSGMSTFVGNMLDAIGQPRNCQQHTGLEEYILPSHFQPTVPDDQPRHFSPFKSILDRV